MLRTMEQCREVTEKYATGRGALLRVGQLILRLFAALL
jgi:cardiolipin synthase